MKTNTLLLGSIFLMALNLSAQNLGDLIKESESLFQKTRPLLVFPKSTKFDPKFDFYSEIDTTKNVNFLESELKKIQSQQFKKDIGLVFKANAQYNFRNSFDEETNNFNIGRVRAELEWNILRSGYTHNRTLSKRLKNEMYMLQEEQVEAERILMRRQFRIDYTYVINSEKIDHLTKFLRFENEYFDFLNKLYFKKYIKRERLIEVSQQIHVLKNQLETLKKTNLLLKDSVSLPYQNRKSLPFLKLRLDSLSYSSKTANLELQKENVYLQHKAINDLNFSFYVQENFNYSRVGHRFFPAVGVRFRAPIRFNHRKKVIDAKLKILAAQHIDKSVGEYNQIITWVGGYNEKLKDVRNQYKGWKVLEERIRILTVLKSELDNQETGVLLLELLEEEFKVLENMLQLKRQLYTTLSHVYELTRASNIETIVTPVDLTEKTEQNKYSISKSLIYSLDFQIQFLKAKGSVKIEVHEQDLKTQEALTKANINFELVKELSSTSVEKAIQKELNQIHIEP